ncbi:MAG: KTSC domain-containing protein [Methylocella sp.]
MTSTTSPARMPAGDEDRPGIGTTLEFPAEPRSDSEPVPPQIQAKPSPVPGSPQALNVVPRAAPDANQLPLHLALLAEAPRATPRESEARSGSAPQLVPKNARTSPSTPDQPPPKTDQWEEFQLAPKPKDSNVFDDFGKPTPKLVQAEARIACPPRDTFENAQAWVHERLKCERHPTPNGLWIEWAEYCPSGPLGYFVLKVKTGQQKLYLFKNIPPAVWEGFKVAPSADKFYHSEIKGKRHWFRLASELKPSAPELTCHG